MGNLCSEPVVNYQQQGYIAARVMNDHNEEYYHVAFYLGDITGVEFQKTWIELTECVSRYGGRLVGNPHTGASFRTELPVKKTFGAVQTIGGVQLYWAAI